VHALRLLPWNRTKQITAADAPGRTVTRISSHDRDDPQLFCFGCAGGTFWSRDAMAERAESDVPYERKRRYLNFQRRDEPMMGTKMLKHLRDAITKLNPSE